MRGDRVTCPVLYPDLRHIALAYQSEEVTRNVNLHSTYIARSRNNIVELGVEVIALSDQFLASNLTNDTAIKLREEDAALAKRNDGFDANEDGVVSWEKGEGGFAQSNLHFNLLMIGECVMVSSR